MIRTQRHSRFVLMSLDEIRATRDIVLQTEETKSNFSGSGKTVYICEVVRPCDYQKETDTAADKLAAEIERVNADNRALRRKIGSMAKRGRPPLTGFLRNTTGSRKTFSGKAEKNHAERAGAGRPRSHDCRNGAGAFPYV